MSWSIFLLCALHFQQGLRSLVHEGCHGLVATLAKMGLPPWVLERLEGSLGENGSGGLFLMGEDEGEVLFSGLE